MTAGVMSPSTHHFQEREMMKFVAMVVGLGIASLGTTYGQENQSRPKMECKVFAVNTDQHELTVIKGEFGSGSSGTDRPQTEAKQYKFKVTNQTKIRWRGGRNDNETLTLPELQAMNNRSLSVPMTIY